MSNRVEAKNAALMVTVDSVDYLIGCEVDFSFEHLNELILKTSRISNGHRERRVRISDIGASCSGVVTTTNESDTLSIFYLEQELVRRSTQALKFVWEDNDGLIKVLAGNFLIESITISNPMGDFSKFDITFKGGGNGVTIDPVLPPDGEEDGLTGDWWTTTPGSTSVNGSVAGHNGNTFAGKNIIGVWREDSEYNLVSGTPGNRQVQYSTPNLNFLNEFNEGETVYVLWDD